MLEDCVKREAEQEKNVIDAVIKEIREENALLRQALEQFANKANWCGIEFRKWFGVENPREIARNALEHKEERKNE